jgi:hypothetical protein
MKRIAMALGLIAFNYGVASALTTNQGYPEDGSVMRLADGSVDCAAYADYAGAEPRAVASACGSANAPASLSVPAAPLPSGIGYAQDIGYISDNFVSFPLNNFPGQTVIGTSTNAYYGMDFDPTGTTLYALNDSTDQLGTIDLATGAFTALVPCAPLSSNWTGLTIDPATGTFYASDATTLYTIDPSTGTPTAIGPFGTSLMIDIAMNTAGEMYGHDIGADSIYRINPATGAATLLGLTGYAANYAQGMDFDNADGTLYIFLYQGGGTNVYGTVDLTTGAVTPLAINSPLGEFEGAIPGMIKYSLGVTLAGKGRGAVTTDPAGIDCGADCSEYFAEDTVVSLMATPALGSKFKGWSGDADCMDGTVTMSGNVACTATFTRFPWPMFIPGISNSQP